MGRILTPGTTPDTDSSAVNTEFGKTDLAEQSKLTKSTTVHMTEQVGNVLDEYQNYTYRATFSALPMSFFYNGRLPIAKGRGGKIIIAQQGVTTKFNLDNLYIQTVPDTNGTSASIKTTYTTNVQFNITEPLGASLLNLLHGAFFKLRDLDKANGEPAEKFYSNETNSKGPLDLPYLLEVDLLGYRDYDKSGFLNAGYGDDEKGDFELINKFVYPLYLTKFDFDPSEAGTNYSFNMVGYHELDKRLPPGTATLNEDIHIGSDHIHDEEDSMLKQLENRINTYLSKSLGKPEDEDFNPDHGQHIVRLQLGDKYQHGKKGSKAWHGDTKTPNFESDVKQTTENQSKTEQTTQEKAVKTSVTEISFNKGISISDAFEQIMIKNEAFCDMVSDREKDNKTAKKPDNPTFAVDIRKSSKARVEDGKTIIHPGGGPAMIVTYTMDLTWQAGVNTLTEPKKLTEEEEKEEIRSWSIRKLYEYTYTGLNDQVLDVDISFPSGQVFLFPDYGGFQPGYRDAKAAATDKKDLDKLRSRKIQLAMSSGRPEQLIKIFEELASDVKNIMTNIVSNTTEFVEGLANLSKPPAPIAKSIKSGSRRLPSSPLAIFQKGKAIANATAIFDDLYSDLADVQKNFEKNLQGLANQAGQNFQQQISKFIAEAATPFDIISTGFGRVSQGIDGFVENINEGLGLEGQFALNVDDIPGLGEVQDIVDELSEIGTGGSSSTTPAGFGTGNSGFSDLDPVVKDSNLEEQYLEELDFQDTEYEHYPMKPKGEPTPPTKQSNATDPKQHTVTTALSYKDAGLPYINELNMTIKGDPYWLGQNVDYSKFLDNSETPPTIFSDGNVLNPVFNTDDSINLAPYGSGSVFLAFTYIFPREYGHYQDAEENRTGVMDIATVDRSYSGYYLITKVLNKFEAGQFTQIINAVKLAANGPGDLKFDDPLDEKSGSESGGMAIRTGSGTAYR